jgi:hypothetical protein
VAIWEAAASEVAATLESGDAYELSAAAYSLLNLEEARLTHFETNQSYLDTIRSLFEDFSAVFASTTEVYFGHTSMQQVAFLLGETFTPSEDTLTTLKLSAVTGSEPGSEYFVGPSLAIPLQDARTLGVPVSVPHELLNQADDIEYLALLLGGGETITQDDIPRFAGVEQLVKDSNAYVRQGVVDVVAQLMLTSTNPTMACFTEGISVLDTALGASPEGMDPSAVALANRVFDSCDRPVPQPRRTYVTEVMNGLASVTASDVDLYHLWILTRIQCAAQPDTAAVGSSQWATVSRFVNKEGGVTSDIGYMSLNGIHSVLQIMETSQDTCRATGVMGA